MNESQVRRVNVLTVAGSDSSGGAGVAMDLKTFAACGVHGLCAIAAVTAQTASRVVSIHCVPARRLERQLNAVLADFDLGAVKIGMLGSAANVHTLAKTLQRAQMCNVVLDPVLTATSGTALLSTRGLNTLRKLLIPLVDLLTPNLPEAEILLGTRIADPVRAARALRDLGARAVLLKGGHGRGRIVRDVLVDGDGVVEFRHPRLRLRARGTGCALSSAIAAGLGQGLALRDAIAAAESLVQRALAASFPVGTGSARILCVNP